MYSKIIFVSALVAIAHAGILVDQGPHSLSSQSIVRHDEPTHQLNTHFTPVYTHASPVVAHGSPVLTHSSPVYHATSVLTHAAPVVHATPVIQHYTPAVHASPVAIQQANVEEHAPAHYEFSYSVEDPHTGDHKSQHEARNGDVVKGEYSLLQPDGSIRKVEYTADDHNGFQAVVHNSAPTVHAVSAPAHGSVVHAAPLVHASPVVHAVPVLSHH